jgi:DNA-binding transcriptional regulator YbjK
MPPPRNLQRRQMLTDAAIDVLGRRGIHQLSHRAVDDAAGLPPGTTTNYFKSRDDLLEAAARRVADLQVADMEAAAGLSGETGLDGLTALLGRSLYEGATRYRTRFLAIFELSLEATRRPALLDALSHSAAASLSATVRQHRVLGLQTPPEQVQALIALFGGALFALVTAPPAAVTPEGAAALGRSIVHGVLDETPR